MDSRHGEDMPKRDVLDLNRESGSRPEASSVRSRTTAQESLRYPVGLEYYKPSYKTLNYTTWKTDVSGKVGFYETLAQIGGEHLKNLKKTQDSVNLAETYNSLNEELRNESREFKKNSESGEGYLEYISDTHAKLSEKYLSGVFDPEYSGKLKTMLLKSKADWENSAFEEEQSMRTAYTLRKTENAINDICVGMVTNPGNFDSGILAIENALEGYRNVAGEQAYAKVAEESRKNFTYCYGLGLLQKNPYGLKNLLQDERIKVLSPQQVNHLMNAAEGEIEKRENQARRMREAIQSQQVTNDAVMCIQLKNRLLEEGADSVSDALMEGMGITEKSKTEIKEARRQLKKAELKQNQINEAMTASVESKQGLGSFSSAQQLGFLYKHLPADATLRSTMKMANEFGLNVNDTGLSSLLYGKILKSDNAEEVMKRLDDYGYAELTGCKLIENPDEDTEYVIGMMRYGGGGDANLTMKAREEALIQVKRMNEDPTYRKQIKEEASNYIVEDNRRDTDFMTLRKKTWEKLEKAAGIYSKWNWNFDEVTSVTNQQYEEAEEFFKAFYKERMRDLMTHGWKPNPAADEIAREMVTYYRPTSLVKNKLMYMPPERRYSELSEKELQKRFKSFAESINEEYIKEKIRPAGYSIELDRGQETPTFKFNNGAGSEGEAPLNIEWSREKEAYEVYLMRDDGTRIYLTEADGRLKTLDFDKIQTNTTEQSNTTIENTQEQKVYRKEEIRKRKQELASNKEARAKRRAEILAKKAGQK